MESCITQKSVKQTKTYFRFFKVSTLCLDDSFAHFCYSLNQLHEVVTWNAFPTALNELPHMLSTCWLLFLHSSETISIGLRSGDLMQHSITLLIGQIALTAWRCVLGHCPVENQIIVPLSPNPDGMVYHCRMMW